MRPKNEKVPANSKKYPPGTRVTGFRQNSYSHLCQGVVVETAATLNNGYRNYCYQVLCDEDGKRRWFQRVSEVHPDSSAREEYKKVYPIIRRINSLRRKVHKNRINFWAAQEHLAKEGVRWPVRRNTEEEVEFLEKLLKKGLELKATEVRA